MGFFTPFAALFLKIRSLSYRKTQPKNDERLDIPNLEDRKWDCLQDMLKARAESLPSGHVISYVLGLTSTNPKKVPYCKLYDEAKQNSAKLASLAGFGVGSLVLLHFDDHWDTILWFWSVLLAHGIPVLSSPLSNVEEHRLKHLQGLSRLLDSPICITRAYSLHQFDGASHTLQIYTLESLLDGQAHSAIRHSPSDLSNSTAHEHKNATVKVEILKSLPAVLMLTSGSTGNAKAVPLRHHQILASVSGKGLIRALPKNETFLNWIGLDHVAGLLETHLQALWMGVDQVHVHAADIVANPQLFLDLLSRHRVSRTFAPNFLLAKLLTACNSNATPPDRWDLSNLTHLVTGGEANDIQTCVAVSRLLTHYGAPYDVIAPGFGMTETCAGAIYNLYCPKYDMAKGLIVASLGRCMPGIEMRITIKETGQAAESGESGDLEVRGAVVFEGYYRNPAATSEAFTDDGWFRTGDQAIIDTEGILHLTGRIKDVININGVKIPTADLQRSIEVALRETRMPGAATEQVTVAYAANDPSPEPRDMAEVETLVLRACMVSTGSRPVVFLVGTKSLHLLPISTLGKISGAKMRTLFEAGAFDIDAAYHRQIINEFKKQNRYMEADRGLNRIEILLREEFIGTMGVESSESFGVETPIFELGFTSMDIIRLKHRINTRLGISVNTIMFLKHYTIRLLAIALEETFSVQCSSQHIATSDVVPDQIMAAEIPTATATNYDPVVTLCPKGSKMPLWLVHPGIGEVLVFVGLAQHLRDDDRPVYALRARGLEPGQPKFVSIAEAVDIYVGAVRRQQPRGPYAIAGYSYGTMLAFEIAKKLEGAESQEVRFLGSFNLPPHIKTRMRQLSWNVCLIHLAQFLDLVCEACVDEEVSCNSSTY
ncbi:acetyl-CoA synthetase-like protein [Whalleya microplaca]|nr:acetyl-CoA synthetase-like protein [Whalleya microplaca]